MRIGLLVALFSIFGYYNLVSVFASGINRAKPSADARIGFMYMNADSKYEANCIREANSVDVKFKIKRVINDGIFHCANVEIHEAAHLLNAAISSTYVPKQAAIPAEIINQTINSNDNPPPQCLKYAEEIARICPLTWGDAGRFRGP